ncbi:hypothetical protein BCR44DRAFT_1434057 [Catenaria anguillulae PL171]|uniref:Uncharacterized protein n=1 Tax=Catenaria anguillulae PL171 TaxID=765915 RepID=A0A1Y2HL84_9FUNG|nr:hypothetical protein BCR44DRAFT_1434057 [Catenaria anguillulae PL171]
MADVALVTPAAPRTPRNTCSVAFKTMSDSRSKSVHGGLGAMCKTKLCDPSRCVCRRSLSTDPAAAKADVSSHSNTSTTSSSESKMASTPMGSCLGSRFKAVTRSLSRCDGRCTTDRRGNCDTLRIGCGTTPRARSECRTAAEGKHPIGCPLSDDANASRISVRVSNLVPWSAARGESVRSGLMEREGRVGVGEKLECAN